jgi:hypothetical protein
VVVVGGCVVGGELGCVVGGEVGWVTGGGVVGAGVEPEPELDAEVGVVTLGVVGVEAGMLVPAAGVVVGVPGVPGEPGEPGDAGVAVEFGVLAEIKADDLPLESTANQSFPTPCPAALPFLSLTKVYRAWW